MSDVLTQLRERRNGLHLVPTAADAESVAPVVGPYARISDAYEDAETGVTEGGVQRQMKVNRLLTEARGWTLADREYIDNNVSAFKKQVIRDAFNDLLEDLAAGVIDGIVCYNLDRLARRVDDLERLIAIYDDGRRAGRQMYFATNEGSIDLSSDDGITLARVMVAFANKASRDTARRVALKHQEMRDEGRKVGGGRPFGWNWENDKGEREYSLHPEESEALKWAAAGLIDGTQNYRKIIAEWAERGLTTPRGRSWTPIAVKGVLSSPRMAGWLVHKDKIAVHSTTGELIRSSAPPILSDDDFEALLSVMARKRDGGSSDASNRKRYLLSGIVRCAECGAKMVGNRRTDKHFYYACRSGSNRANTGADACGKVTASGWEVDRMVEELLVPIIVAETASVHTDSAKPFQRELLELQDERDALLLAYREKRAPSDAALPRLAEIDRESGEMRSQQAEWLRTQRVLSRSQGVTKETWPHLSLEEKRGHVLDFIEAIYISAATRRGNTFDRSRVSPPVWRKQGGGAEPIGAVPR